MSESPTGSELVVHVAVPGLPERAEATQPVLELQVTVPLTPVPYAPLIVAVNVNDCA
ncbi:MAG TPA: hypothetical protein VMQ86_10100 [Bryobacteraceae bacterium]|nr:hypothetical protein [Bryobacteraceae bacterium]